MTSNTDNEIDSCNSCFGLAQQRNNICTPLSSKESTEYTNYIPNHEENSDSEDTIVKTSYLHVNNIQNESVDPQEQINQKEKDITIKEIKQAELRQRESKLRKREEELRIRERILEESQNEKV